MDLNLKNKVIIVSGGSSGIGTYLGLIRVFWTTNKGAIIDLKFKR